ncbi:MAG: carbohydrate ABC transporter permease [Maledivibacter sp.]|jgi:multiple sugar transport system permease protein|nr:carbohydrate ABC transporter permease [Maledivibacter sp.]
MNIKIEKRLKRIFLYLMVTLIVAVVVLPYLWLIISSISKKVDLLEVPLKLSSNEPTFENYKNIIFGTSNRTSDAASQFMTAFKNSTIVSVLVTVISMIIGVPAAYAFCRVNFKRKSFLFNSIMFLQMIPSIALIIPMYMIMIKFKLLDKKLTLVVVYLSFILPYMIWIMKGYFEGIPVEVEEAALVDGCNRFKAFYRIVLPISSSGLAATTIFVFIMSWNEFFYALNFTYTTSSKTLPVLITEFSSKFGTDYILTSTAGVIASIPPVFLSLIFQKYIISGLSSGAVKK